MRGNIISADRAAIVTLFPKGTIILSAHSSLVVPKRERPAGRKKVKITFGGRSEEDGYGITGFHEKRSARKFAARLAWDSACSIRRARIRGHGTRARDTGRAGWVRCVVTPVYVCAARYREKKRRYARRREKGGSGGRGGGGGIGELRQSTRPHRDSNSIAGIAGQAISHSHVLNIDC